MKALIFHGIGDIRFEETRDPVIHNQTDAPEGILTQHESLSDVVAAYKAFDQRKPGWIKLELQPAAKPKNIVKQPDNHLATQVA